MNNQPVDLVLLRTFVTVVQCSGFLPASELLGRSPSAISMQIQRLEEHLGCLLFIRNARHTTLTRDGERLLDHARRLLGMEERLRGAFLNEPLKGEVMLGVPDDVVQNFPMDILRRFGERHPGVTVSITVGHTPSLLAAVERRALDIAIVTYAESIRGIEKAEILFREPEVWCGVRGGTARERIPLPLTIWEKGWAWYEPAMKILRDAGVNFRVVLHSENINARVNAILADLAVGPLPQSQVDERLEPIEPLQALPDLPEYGLGMVHDAGSEPTVALAGFLRERFSGGPGGGR